MDAQRGEPERWPVMDEDLARLESRYADWQRRLYEALQEVWQGGGQPEYMVMDGQMHQLYTDEMRRLDRLQKVCTPAGLRGLFPGLKGGR